MTEWYGFRAEVIPPTFPWTWLHLPLRGYPLSPLFKLLTTSTPGLPMALFCWGLGRIQDGIRCVGLGWRPFFLHFPKSDWHLSLTGDPLGPPCWFLVAPPCWAWAPYSIWDRLSSVALGKGTYILHMPYQHRAFPSNGQILVSLGLINSAGLPLKTPWDLAPP